MKLKSRISQASGLAVVVVGAVDYSGLGVKELKRLGNDGIIQGRPDPESGRGDWIFDRESLDAYRAGQLGNAAMHDALHKLGVIGAR